MPKVASRGASLPGPAKYRQVAAIPVRERDGRKEVCLITTRETQRWTVPKGWPMKGKKDCVAAAIEAREEAGLEGTVSKQALGRYLYWKRRPSRLDLVEVTAYRFDVECQLEQWPEKGQREQRWLPPGEAADLVDEPGLVALITNL